VIHLPPVRSSIAILGGGNLGQALARGWVQRGVVPADRLTVVRRRVEALAGLAAEGIRVQAGLEGAVQEADLLILAVQPGQIEELMELLRPHLVPERHVLVSVMAGVTMARLESLTGVPGIRVIRAMPNTAIAVGESTTCITLPDGVGEAGDEVVRLFDAVGTTLLLPEAMLGPATALCACGIAFFLRAIRAASEGGVEIGFHPEEAIQLAAQTAKGAATLLLERGSHPEEEVDRVTTPGGSTIAGLNAMEQAGFSSALIQGVVRAARRADELQRRKAD